MARPLLATLCLLLSQQKIIRDSRDCDSYESLPEPRIIYEERLQVTNLFYGFLDYGVAVAGWDWREDFHSLIPWKAMIVKML
jgi:hypothetical protein